jgi:predicted amidohydrolase YtcJ
MIQQEPADLVVTNGKVITADEPLTEAQAVAVRGDRIVALGSAADVRRYVGQGLRSSMSGDNRIPGFIEATGTFTASSEVQLNLKLMPAMSWDQIVAMVADAAKTAKPGEWIIGRGGTRRNGRRAEPERRGVSTHVY